jgi:hypothetical protein
MYFLAMMPINQFHSLLVTKLMLPTFELLRYYENYVPGIHTSILNSEMDTYSSIEDLFSCNLLRNCP